MKRIDENTLLIEKSYKDGMRVDSLIFVNKELEKHLEKEAVEQIANVATLPGIVKYAIAMPDVHKGYGFPIGGVAAFDIEKGVISPGGIGYDINCGVRLVSTSLKKEDIEKKKKELVEALYNNIPLGVGSEGGIDLSETDYKNVLKKGAIWAVSNGFGNDEDIKNIESNGYVDCEIDFVTSKAKERGRHQLGTLGSGNHFLEVQYVDEIYNEEITNKLGFSKNQIFVMIHTGSRGFGHQICSDYINVMMKASQKYGIKLYDRELASAPFSSEEGQKYFNSMNAAANFAWANRQILKDLSEKVFLKVFKISPHMLNFTTVYDVAHNIAKLETYEINGVKKKLLVHRKGATRAFGPSSNEIPEKYRRIGQPVIIPGDMGRESYLLTGTDLSVETFSSTCHGAGRVLSRTKAIELARTRDIKKELEEKGIYVKANSRTTLNEEMSDSYKNISDVVNVVENLGISKKLLKLKPLCVIKG